MLCWGRVTSWMVHVSSFPFWIILLEYSMVFLLAGFLFDPYQTDLCELCEQKKSVELRSSFVQATKERTLDMRGGCQRKIRGCQCVELGLAGVPGGLLCFGASSFVPMSQ